MPCWEADASCLHSRSKPPARLSLKVVCIVSASQPGACQACLPRQMHSPHSPAYTSGKTDRTGSNSIELGFCKNLQLSSRLWDASMKAVTLSQTWYCMFKVRVCLQPDSSDVLVMLTSLTSYLTPKRR